ncbi:MAG: hypothetical protein ACOX5G_02205 [Kiritimatiellia bacterium]
MKTTPFPLAVLAVLSLCATCAAAARNLFWQYSPGLADFAHVDNWLEDDTTPIAFSPVYPDTVRFLHKANTSEQSEYFVQLHADVVVSNFEYRVESDSGILDFDLDGHCLEVSNSFQIVTRCYASNSDLRFHNGTIRQIGDHRGKLVWGWPTEDSDGFYINRSGWQNAGANVVFDNVDIEIGSGMRPYMAWFSLQGRNHHLTFENGSSLSCTNLQFDASPVDGSVRITFTGEGTRLSVYNGNVSVSGLGVVVAKLDDDSELLFTDGAELEAALITCRGSGRTVFNGGSHSLHGVNNWGDVFSLLCSGSHTLLLTNGASVAAGLCAANRGVSINNGSFLRICDGSLLTTPREGGNTAFHVGYLATGATTGDSVIEIDNGSLIYPWIRFGSQAANSNNTLRIKGPTSLFKQTQGTEWGQQRPMAFNYGTTIEFELPVEGYHDGTGAARAPVYAVGCIDGTDGSAAPPALKLSTREFDKANIKTSVTLMEASTASTANGYDTAAFFGRLIDNVTWVDNPNWHGTLSIVDSRKLVYTSASIPGTILFVR